MANPGQEYRLEYGDPRARAPAFDTSGIDAALAFGTTPARATLGQPVPGAQPDVPAQVEETANAQSPELAPVPPAWESLNRFFNPWVFGVVLLVLGALLLVSLAQAVSRLDNGK